MNVFDLYATLSLETSKYDSGMAAAKQAAESFGSAVDTVVEAGTRAYTGLVKDSVQAYSQYEETADGIRRIMGDSAEGIIKNSQNAYKNAQMSSAEYLGNAQVLSGALLRAVGDDTEAVTDLVDMAMRDVSDNANAMGSNLNFVLNAYRGFARQEFRMLDNLYLGYGGTKTEARQLLYDMADQVELCQALGIEFNKLPETYDKMDFSMLTLDNVIKAIHVRQVQMEIEGTTLQEGATHIQGTIRTTIAAWKDLQKTFAGEMDMSLDDAIEHFLDSVFGDQQGTGLLNTLIPRISSTISGISKFLVKATPILAEAIPKMLQELQPEIESAIDNIGTLITTILPSIIDYLWPVVRDLLTSVTDLITQKMHEEGGIFGLIADVVDFIRDNSESIPGLIMAVWGSITALNIGSGIMHFITQLSAMINKVTLVVAAIGLLATLLYAYRGEISLFFNTAGTVISKAIDNAKLQFNNLRLFIENMNWGALFTMVITDISLGLTDLVNRGIQAIEDALNNFITTNPGLQTALNFLGIKFDNPEKPIDLPEIDTKQLEKDNARAHYDYFWGKDAEKRKQIEANKLEMARNEQDMFHSMDKLVLGTGDTRSIGERYRDMPGEILGQLGFKSNLFSGFFSNIFTDDSIEKIDTATNSMTGLNTQLSKSVSLLGGGSEMSSASGEMSSASGEMGSASGEMGSELGQNGLIGGLQDVTDYLGSDFVEGINNGANALTGTDASLVTSIILLKTKVDETKGSFEGLSSFLTGQWLGALSTAANVETLLAALKKVLNMLGDIIDAAGQVIEDLKIILDLGEDVKNVDVPGSDNNGGNNGGNPPRAFGGSVLAGETYWVGEKGPEAFVPNQPGTIVPTNKLAGATTQQFIFNFNGDVYGDEISFRAMVTKVAKGVIRQEVRAAA